MFSDLLRNRQCVTGRSVINVAGEHQKHKAGINYNFSVNSKSIFEKLRKHTWSCFL